MSVPPVRRELAGAGGRHAYTEAVQQVLDVSNDVAAELAAIGDGVLEALRDRLRCTIRLRGNWLTIEGDDERVTEARAVVDELVELVEGGHQIGPDTVGAVLNALDQAEDVRDVFEDVVWRPQHRRTSDRRYPRVLADTDASGGVPSFRRG